MKLNFMLIDDNKFDLFINRKIIENASCDNRVRTFKNGQSAIKFLEIFEKKSKYHDTFLPNVILLDLNMPEMNGFQFLKEFKKLERIVEKPIKIYMLSSTTNFNDIIKIKNEKLCVGFISKPLTVEVLNKIMSESKPYVNQNYYETNEVANFY
ncbi:MAG: response regulator [Algicola sp.]|nr:response regulator [Algicola sp.]